MMRRWLRSLVMAAGLLVAAGVVEAANNPLQVIMPRASGTSPDAGGPTMNANHRIYWAYPAIDYTITAKVIGGLYPYTYSLPSGAPTGMTIDADTGVITWTGANVSGGPYTPTFRVVDAESTQVETTWTITVTAADTSRFAFVDQDAADHTGNGAIGTPYKDIVDLKVAGTLNKTVVFRASTSPYTLAGMSTSSSGAGLRVEFNGVAHSTQWIAYPGESPQIDFIGAGSPYIRMQGSNSGTPIYIDGLAGVDCPNMCVQLVSSPPGGDYYVVSHNTMTGLTGVPGGNNPAFVMNIAAGDQTVVGASYGSIQGNVFENYTDSSCLKVYSQTKLLIGENICRNGTSGSDLEGIALKGGRMDRVTVRGNTIHGLVTAGTTGGGIGGNNNMLINNLEILYNRIYDITGGGQALQLGNDPVAIPTIYVYRNTFLGTVEIEHLDTANGPFYFSNNVIVSPDASGGCIANSRIRCTSATDTSRLIVSASPNDDIDYTASDNCTTSLGVLQDASPSNTCRTDYGPASANPNGHEIGGTPDLPPTAPTNLQVVDTPGDGGTQLNLTWTVSASSGVTAQRIYRSTVSGSGYSLVQTYNDNTTTAHTDTGLSSSTIYYYIIRAYNGTTTLESANSGEAYGEPIVNPTPPISVTGRAGGGMN